MPDLNKIQSTEPHAVKLGPITKSGKGREINLITMAENPK